MNIVSLLPSATEIIVELGLEDRLVGVTHECDFPETVLKLPKVTKTLLPSVATSCEIDGLVREHLKSNKALYSLDLPTLKRLSPNLIVTQALCDVCAVAADEVYQAARELPSKPQVINLEPSSLEEIFECMQVVGDATGTSHQARECVEKLQQRVDKVINQVNSIGKPPVSLVMLEWLDPLFSAGHWSPQLIEFAGGRELIGIAGQRSKSIVWQDVLDANPEVLIIACCGFNIERTERDMPILKAFPGYRDLQCVRNNRVYVMDGNAYFSRPGPRLVEGLELLAQLLHAEVHLIRSVSLAI